MPHACSNVFLLEFISADSTESAGEFKLEWSSSLDIMFIQRPHIPKWQQRCFN